MSDAGTERVETGGPALRLERRDDGIALIRIDCPGRSQNTLDRALIEQAADCLDGLEGESGLRGVVFISDKPGSFIAGADVHMIESCGDAGAVSELSRTGQRIFDRIERLRVPVVAAIDGVCLGGGLELALACHGRVATEAEHTRLGVPEVQLGLIPGSGGTQRLPALIGAPAAFDLMLTGRQLAARKARRLGLLDDVVAVSILLPAAERLIEDIHAGRLRRGGRVQRVRRWLIQGNSLGRRILLSQVRKRTASKTRGHYPAPPRLIDCVETGLAEGREQGLASEAEAFGELAMTPEARQLMGLYFVTTAMKKDNGVEDDDVAPRPVSRVAVLGAGLMGAGIGLVSVDRAGASVRLKDVRAEGLGTGLAHMHEQIEGRRRRGSINAFEAERRRRAITATLDFSGFSRLDLVVEAVFEDLDLKHRMLADVERECREDVIFASNTSSIPIARIAEGARRPENVVGMHYFSPVEKMPLLEVIAHEDTAPEVVATAVAFGRRQGKTPIVVRDGAGFYVNRILAPYINEAVELLREGVPIERIDGALVDFGFPVGPFKLLDEVGLDVSAHVAPILYEAFGERMRPTETATRMVEAGRLGRKSGWGFYRYGGRRSGRRVDETVYELLEIRPDRQMPDAEIVDRTLLMMLNEAVRCLDEGIIRGVRDGDVGAVFGIGFPPFRGGPFRYLDARGPATVRERLDALRRELGDRFAPAPALERLADAGGSFHES